MATPKEIKTRISAVQNTKKITRTMEMVATAKAKKAVDRVNESKLYSEKLKELTFNIASSGSLDNPLLKEYETVKRQGILVISANRGLCGGFNNNIIKLAQERVAQLREEGKQVEVHLIGKKVIGSFKFMNIEFHKGYTHIDDKPTYQDACLLADDFMNKFIQGELHSIEIVHTKYLSSSSQEAVLEKILPFSLETSSQGGTKPEESEKGTGKTGSFIFEPSPEAILSSLLPKAVRINIFQSLLDSAASEQIARRVAMKNATENATEIVRDLTLLYNRVRQAKITQEIAELVGGAAAIS